MFEDQRPDPDTLIEIGRRDGSYSRITRLRDEPSWMYFGCGTYWRLTGIARMEMVG